VPLCTAPAWQDPGQAVSDGAGGVILSWQDHRNPTGVDVYAQRLTAAGTIAEGWSPGGIPVALAPGDQLSPRMLPDGRGGAFVCWQDRRNGTDFDLYLQRLTSSGAIAPGWPDGGLPVCDLAGNQSESALAPDGSGGVVIAWQDWRSGIDYDIFAQRITAGGAIAPGWPTGGAALCAAAADQRSPALAADGQGGAFVAWRDRRNGPDFDLYAQRIRGDGSTAPGWPPEGLSISTAAGDQVEPKAIAGASGAWIVAWTDGRDASSDIYAQSVTDAATLAPGWSDQGNPVCTAPGDQISPALISDDAGGALLVWRDLREGRGDVYAQRITAGGTPAPGWAPGGVPVMRGGKLGFSAPALVPDGRSGAIVAWSRASGAPWGDDITLQHLTAGGTIAWGWRPGGISVLIPGDQFSPALVPDGAGGAVVCFGDDRGGDSDLYADHFTAEGTVPSLASPIQSGAEPGAVSLVWRLDGRDDSWVDVLRKGAGESAWAVLDHVLCDGMGVVDYDDRTVRPGERYCYRVGSGGVPEGEAQSETCVDVPAAAGLVLRGLSPNPSAGEVSVRFSLPGPGPASLEIIDLTGRRVLSSQVSPVRGDQSVRLAAPGLRPGVYQVVLVQGAARSRARLVVAR